MTIGVETIDNDKMHTHLSDPGATPPDKVDDLSSTPSTEDTVSQRAPAGPSAVWINLVEHAEITLEPRQTDLPSPCNFDRSHPATRGWPVSVLDGVYALSRIHLVRLVARDARLYGQRVRARQEYCLGTIGCRSLWSDTVHGQCPTSPG